MYVTAYQYARDGMSDEQIAQSLGVAGVTFRRWCANDPALEDAVARGREPVAGQGTVTFSDYIYQHLPQHLRDLWDEIHECAALENGVERAEALLRRGGKQARQHLFIHALATTGFNVSKAMRLVNVSRKSLDNWTANDPAFAELMDELHWHKDNFFETAFINRVRAGDTAAIIHAAKSKLAHRGYNERVVVEHTGTVNHSHTIDITDLDLPLACRVQIREAIRQKTEAERGGGGAPLTIEAEPA